MASNKRVGDCYTAATNCNRCRWVTDQGLPSWVEIEEAAHRLALASTPAELHGALCGWLAAGGDSSHWLGSIMASPELADPGHDTPLGQLHLASLAQIEDPDFGFRLLLPDAASAHRRAEALFAWCRAFLGGFGLAMQRGALSPEAEEALQDLANLGAAQLDETEDDGDEEALAEIEEYLRMAVLMLHADCVLGRRPQQPLH